MLTLSVNDQVNIFGGHTGKKIGEGKVVKVCKRWVEVSTSLYARPVRYRTRGPLEGVRIVGGIAEYLNDRIRAKEGQS